MTSKQLDTLSDQGRLWLEGESTWDVYCTLFSRSGFSEELIERANADHTVHLFYAGRNSKGDIDFRSLQIYPHHFL